MNFEGKYYIVIAFRGCGARGVIVDSDYILDPLFPFLFAHDMTTNLTYSSFRIDKINVNG